MAISYIAYFFLDFYVHPFFWLYYIYLSDSQYILMSGFLFYSLPWLLWSYECRLLFDYVFLSDNFFHYIFMTFLRINLDWRVLASVRKRNRFLWRLFWTIFQAGLVLDGNSGIGAHVWSDLGYWTCFRHLYRSTIVANFK